MNLLGLSPFAYAAGLLGFGGALFVLHMLRVRLRRQRVDSLLFFRQVGAVHKPRVLLGLPARLWSFLLGLALLGLAFTTFADPVDAADGPSRVVLVDAGPGVEPATLEEIGSVAEELATRGGLGPRGRIVAFGDVPRTLWTATEPSAQLADRIRALAGGGTPDSFWDGLRAAAAGLGPDDEIVVLGGPRTLPVRCAGVPVVRGGFDGVPGAAITGVEVRHALDGRHLVVEASSGGAEAEVLLRDGDAVVARAGLRTEAGATARVTLGPIDADAHPGLALELASPALSTTAVPFPLAESPRIRVHVAPSVAPCVGAAIEAEPRLELAGAPTDADVLVTDAARSGSSDERPVLAFVPGVGDAERAPRCTATNPLPLSLRDRRRTGSALPYAAGEIWVEDAATGEALVRRGADGIDAVSWLLDDPTHRDVPTLICGSLLALAPTGPSPRFRGALPPAAAADSRPVDLTEVADPFPWALALLALALGALVVDGWLHHRGRVA